MVNVKIITKPIISVGVGASNSANVAINGTAYCTGGSYYEGDYVINPRTTDNILNTKNHLMSDDLTVKAVRFSKTSNASGGDTIYIGD